MLSIKTNQGSFQPKMTQFFSPSIIDPMALVVLPSYIMCCNPPNPNPSSIIAQPRPLCPLLPPPSLLSCIGPSLSYGPPWAHYLGGYKDRLLGGPLGLPDLRSTVPVGVKHKDYRGEVLS
jgi:hypothetical protein